MSDRTILKHEDPSKETWNTIGTKVKKNISEHAFLDKKFSVKYKTDYGTIKLGKIKAPAIDSVIFGRLKNTARAKAFGISFTKEF